MIEESSTPLPQNASPSKPNEDIKPANDLNSEIFQNIIDRVLESGQ